MKDSLKVKILDCTLRDGGYYTNWDFGDELVTDYIEAFNHLPIDYIEVGYRSNPLKGYYGKYFYCPVYLLQKIKILTKKKVVIILNEKDVSVNEIEVLLSPCKGLVDMVRLAIDPKNFNRAIKLAKTIKEMNFEVGFNVMYMSNWKENKNFIDQIPQINGVVDVFYMVDSYGGVYPDDIRGIYGLVRSKTDVPIGFHGHNNLELALINTLTAIECGVSMVDVTVTGMGRGAGNLKTELLLTALHAQGKREVDFNFLSRLVDPFTRLQQEYGWGTNLPYMVSGANSLPQKDVMDWMAKRYYSLNSIIRALNNQSEGIKDNLKLEVLEMSIFNTAEVVIVGGGISVKEHFEGINEYLKKHPDLVIIHASSKNAILFKDLPNPQYFCLMGNEGHRMESVFENHIVDSSVFKNSVCVLPPFPRKMGTYIPEILRTKAFELYSLDIFENKIVSQTAMAFQLAANSNHKALYTVGFDGYSGYNISEKDQDLFIENDLIFKRVAELGYACLSLTPTRYKELQHVSVYQMI